MSLPQGVLNQPAMAVARPAVLGGLARIALRVVWLVMPLIIHSAVQAPGVRCLYECAGLQAQIADTRGELRTLRAKRAELLTPSRLREHADRLGLVPTPLDSPWHLGTIGNSR